MNSSKLRLFAAAIAAVFMFSDIAAAMPIAPTPELGEISPTLARVVRGGGGRGVAVHRGGAYRGGAVRGGAVRGGVYRGGVVRGGGYRGGAVVVGGRGAWGRGYRWAPGGAIAAGAAIGFIAAGSAAAYAATRPPAPGLCWY